MNSASASDVCVQWLKSALRSLTPGSDSIHATAARVPERHRAFMDAICLDDVHAAETLCRTHDRDSGNPNRSVIDLIVPTVHQLEREWLAHTRSYSEVLQAFWNLQQVLQLRQDSDARAVQDTPRASHGSVVLAAAPGNEHRLGALVVSAHFRASGWGVRTLSDASKDSLLQALHAQHTDVLGLSVGSDAGLLGLGDLLRELRALSHNPGLRIVLGGNIFDAPAAHYDWLGADCVALTPDDALQYCASFAQRRPH